MFLGAPQLGLMSRDAESKTPVCIVTLAPADPAADDHGTPMLNGFPGPEICAVRVSAADAPDPDAKAPADAVAALKRELLSSLSDPDAQVRVSAISAVRNWEGESFPGEGPRVASKLWGDAAARAAILRAAGDSDYHVRWTAVWTIFQHGGQDEEVGRVVSRTLFDPNLMVRQASGYCVGKLGMKDLFGPEEEVTDTSLDELLSGWSFDESKKYFDESRNYGPGNKRTLLQTLKAENASQRGEAAWLLGEYRYADAAGALMDALSDDAPEVRRAAAHALGTLGEKDAVGALTGLANDPDGRVRVMAAWALAKLGEQSGFAKLTALLRDREPRTAAQAAEMLGVLGKEETVPMLLEALRDKRPAVAGAAVMALRPFLAGPKGDAVKAALKQLAADSPSPYVRQAAAVVMQAAK
jgi:HEAT repeat protein